MDYTNSYQALRYFVDDQIDVKWFLDRTAEHGQVESEKSTSYELMVNHQIPIPKSQKFSNIQELAGLLKQPFPYVVKFDTSITLGVQTVVVKTAQEAMSVFDVSKRVNSQTGIVQQFVHGQEFTVTVLVGQHNWVYLGTAKDYKKQFDGDQGLNTFGMGSLAPAPQTHSQTDQIIDKLVGVLRKQENYLGFLSCQFIVNDSGVWMLECNTRFCDPEFQTMLELLDSSFITSLRQCQLGQHIDQPAIDRKKRAVTISVVHNDWPKYITPDTEVNVDLSPFRVWRGTHHNKVWWGTVTNSGTASYQELAMDLYQWLAKQNLGPYRYRTDIGKV